MSSTSSALASAPVAEPRISLIPESVESAAPGALELCELAGLTLDGWQAQILEASLGEDADGRYSAYEVALIAPRQNGKSEVATARLLVGLYLLDERLIFSSHMFDSAMVVFQRLVRAIESAPQLSKRIAKISNSHGSESVRLKDGAQVHIRTRTKQGGRGHSSDALLFDEAHILSKVAHGALTPVVSASRRPQLWYLATAPGEDNEDAIVLAGIRERALEGAGRLAYAEFSAAEELSEERAHDPEVWRQANPAYEIRIPREQIEAEYQAMDPTTFGVERLGVGFWPRADGLPGVIDLDAWEACEDSDTPLSGPVFLGFDVARDRQHTTIAAASVCDDGLAHIEIIERRPGTDVAERLAELQHAHQPTAIVTDSKGPVASLLPELEQAGVKATVLEYQEVAAAAGMLFDKVAQQRLRYRFHKALDAAVKGAETRPLGDAGWTWSRKSSAVDVSPLTAATYATYGALTMNTGPTCWDLRELEAEADGRTVEDVLGPATAARARGIVAPLGPESGVSYDSPTVYGGRYR
jgi:hypothetical protein